MVSDRSKKTGETSSFVEDPQRLVAAFPVFLRLFSDFSFGFSFGVLFTFCRNPAISVRGNATYLKLSLI